MKLLPDDQAVLDVTLARVEALALAIRQQTEIEATKGAIVALWDAIVPALSIVRAVEQHTRTVAIREYEGA